MNRRSLAMALALSLLPVVANGQSPDAEIIGPTPFRASEPPRWKDGYTGWRGRQFFRPDWQTFKADDGATFVIDMKSIANIAPDGVLMRVVAYLIEGDTFEPRNLITFAFNCKNFVEVVSSVPS